MEDRETARLMLAAAALQGMTSCISAFVETPEDIKQWTDVIPREAVFLADATLAELSKTPPPARTKETPSPPTDPGESGAGEHSSDAGGMVPGGAHNPAVAGSIPAPATSLWDCEVDRYRGDPPCPGPIVYDPESKARLCAVHMAAVPSVRAEWHRRNKDRNAPAAPIARLAG